MIIPGVSESLTLGRWLRLNARIIDEAVLAVIARRANPGPDLWRYSMAAPLSRFMYLREQLARDGVAEFAIWRNGRAAIAAMLAQKRPHGQ